MKSEKNKNLIPIIACVAAVISALAAFTISNQAKLANKVRLRPYLTINNTSNRLIYEKAPFIVLPYQLKNSGVTPALRINKGYVSYLVEKSGEKKLVQNFRESGEKIDALLPNQLSAVHVDSINITGFDIEKIDKIRVELKIIYQGFNEIDTRKYYSKSIFELYPTKTANNKIVFAVSQPALDFGFENEKKLRVCSSSICSAKP